MVHIKAYKGSEIRRFEIDPGTTFAQLNEAVYKLFGLTEDDSAAISYCDRDGDVIRLSSDGELQTALKHLGEDDTWKLQVAVSHKHHPHPAAHHPSHYPHHHHYMQAHQPATSWWDLNPFHMHHSVRDPFRGGLMDSLFGHSLWNDDPFGVDQLWEHQRRLLNEQKKKAELAQRNAMRQASVDAKRAADEVQTKSGEVAEANQGEVADKKSKVVYQHFGSWEPKVEKGDNYVITTYGPVGYRVHYGHDENETSGENDTAGEDKPSDKQTEEEATKMD